MSDHDNAMRKIVDEFACGCEACAHTAATCPATSSAYVQEIATLRRDYDKLAKRTNQLEHLVGRIAGLLREDMTQ